MKNLLWCRRGQLDSAVASETGDMQGLMMLRMKMRARGSQKEGVVLNLSVVVINLVLPKPSRAGLTAVLPFAAFTLQQHLHSSQFLTNTCPHQNQ